jgi:hypothetical protein
MCRSRQDADAALLLRWVTEGIERDLGFDEVDAGQLAVLVLADGLAVTGSEDEMTDDHDYYAEYMALPADARARLERTPRDEYERAVLSEHHTLLERIMGIVAAEFRRQGMAPFADEREPG